MERRQRKHNPRGTKKYFTAAKSKEELQEILDDVDLDQKHEGKALLGYKSKGSTSTSALSGGLPASDPYSDAWSPTTYAAFKLLISAKFAAALWTTISDCDETYNYWEPAHYLLYGKGFQTWEYSPVYALRSYAYLWVHALPAKIYTTLLNPSPLLVFFFIRCLLALASSTSEVFLYRAARKYVGSNVSCIALITSLFSPGLFMSSTAFLPSSFSSYMTALAIGAWMEGLNGLAIFSVAVSSLLSWPFAALTGLLIALDILLLQRKVIVFGSWCIISLVTILVPMIAIDSSAYGKLVIPPLNIVKYNIFSSKGPDLYGTESWTFYLLNGFLNFNIMFLLSFFTPILLICGVLMRGTVRKEKWVITGTIFVWLGVFIVQPHKEERFLFPIYTLIPYCAAIGLECVQEISGKVLRFAATNVRALGKILEKVNYGHWATVVAIIWIMTTCIIGCSRIVAVYYGYRAPFDVFFNLHREGVFSKLETDFPDREFNVCYGKEWYRFPTSFLLPSANWHVRFIQSEFKGQLPNLYPLGDRHGTRRIPEHMNDANAEEPTRYVNVFDCDFLVDAVTTASELEPDYSANTKEWIVISEQEFLNSQKSHSFFRAFYIPFLSSKYTHYDRYVFLERNQKRRRKQKPKAVRPDSFTAEELASSLNQNTDL